MAQEFIEYVETCIIEHKYAPDTIYGRAKPMSINERNTFGNWEFDTIVGKKGTAAVLLAADEYKNSSCLIKQTYSVSIRTASNACSIT